MELPMSPPPEQPPPADLQALFSAHGHGDVPINVTTSFGKKKYWTHAKIMRRAPFFAKLLDNVKPGSHNQVRIKTHRNPDGRNANDGSSEGVEGTTETTWDESMDGEHPSIDGGTEDGMAVHPDTQDMDLNDEGNGRDDGDIQTEDYESNAQQSIPRRRTESEGTATRRSKRKRENHGSPRPAKRRATSPQRALPPAEENGEAVPTVESLYRIRYFKGKLVERKKAAERIPLVGHEAWECFLRWMYGRIKPDRKIPWNLTVEIFKLAMAMGVEDLAFEVI
ncbi:hypothetical protein ABW19_dt0205098 [Dactylella cylindrospora]|nr:hypothetical protein ABW19_dt0205098 [Dactylella cylindrospora]